MDEHQPPEQTDKLEETLEETFPASDAPANTVETGIGLKTPDEVRITDNLTASRFERTIGADTAYLAYERRADTLIIMHTEVPPALRGRDLGGSLVQHALDVARGRGLRVVVVCPYARAYLRRHPPSHDVSVTTDA